MARPKVDPEKAAEQFQLDDSSFDPELDSPYASLLKGPEQKESAGQNGPAKQVRDEKKQAASKFSPSVLAMAEALGLSESDLEEAGNDEGALKLLTMVLRGRSLASRQQAVANAVEAAPSAAVDEELDGRFVKLPPGVEEQKPPEAKKPAEGKKPAGKLKLDFSQYDDDLAGALRELDERLSRLEDEYPLVKEKVIAKERQEIYSEIDRAFEELGPAYAKLFGKGPASSLDAAGLELERRMAVLQSIQRNPGKGDKPLRQLIKERAEKLFGQAQMSPEGAERLGGMAKLWNAGVLAQPTSRALGEEPKGELRAARAVSQLLRDKGKSLDDFPASEEDGLPG